MLPIVEKSKLTEAKYTKLLKDISVAKIMAISELLYSFDDTTDLYNHFLAKYRYYEICDEDEEVFVQIVTDTYNEYKEYYKQVLDAYKKDIDIDDITKKSSSRTDTNSGGKSTNGSTTSNNTHREYDLPNKVIDPTDENGYLTAKDTNSGLNTISDTETHNSTYKSDNDSTDNREFIRLKNEYLHHIRDIYEEFTDKFYECFLHVY